MITQIYFAEAQSWHASCSYTEQQPYCLPEPAQPFEAVPNIQLINPPDYGLEPLHAVHARSYLEFLSDHQAELDMDSPEITSYLGSPANYIGPNSWQAIQRSAHSAVAAALSASSSNLEDAIACALSYPNGQHAHHDHASTACYVNNQAIAANTLLKCFNRVGILSIGPKHADGVQQIFYKRADVMTISLYGKSSTQRNGSAGAQNEMGAGIGYGYNLNFPLAIPILSTPLMKSLDNAIGALQDYRAQAIVLSLHHEVSGWACQLGYEINQRVRALSLPTVVLIESKDHTIDNLFETESFFSEVCRR